MFFERKGLSEELRIASASVLTLTRQFVKRWTIPVCDSHQVDLSCRCSRNHARYCSFAMRRSIECFSFSTRMMRSPAFAIRSATSALADGSSNLVIDMPVTAATMYSPARTGPMVNVPSDLGGIVGSPGNGRHRAHPPAA